MHSATFRFYASLNDFLPHRGGQRRFHYDFWGHPAVKDAIEAIGPPHTEVDLILVNGQSMPYSYALQNGDDVSVYPRFTAFDISALTRVRPTPIKQIRFVLDAHLGQLASYLRMLGFDSLYRNDYPDSELARLSAFEERILLTKDRGLLKRNQVQHGYCVRAVQPRKQIVEVLSRFECLDAVLPFTRCMRCNQVLQDVTADEVRARVPVQVLQVQKRFRICPDCRRVYWQGSHHTRMKVLIQSLLEGVTSPQRPM